MRGIPLLPSGQSLFDFEESHRNTKHIRVNDFLMSLGFLLHLNITKAFF